MTICNGGIRLVELGMLKVMLEKKDNGKSKEPIAAFDKAAMRSQDLLY